jgi:hypothetical protein
MCALSGEPWDLLMLKNAATVFMESLEAQPTQRT